APANKQSPFPCISAGTIPPGGISAGDNASTASLGPIAPLAAGASDPTPDPTSEPDPGPSLGSIDFCHELHIRLHRPHLSHLGNDLWIAVDKSWTNSGLHICEIGESHFLHNCDSSEAPASPRASDVLTCGESESLTISQDL